MPPNFAQFASTFRTNCTNRAPTQADPTFRAVTGGPTHDDGEAILDGVWATQDEAGETHELVPQIPGGNPCWDSSVRVAHDSKVHRGRQAFLAITVGLILSASFQMMHAATAHAQCTGRWVQMPVSGPAPRAEAAMAFDEARGVAVLFGGDNRGDTWEWDGGSWRLASGGGGPGNPPARSGLGTMVYDSTNQVCLLHGGLFGAGGVNDTWAWNGTAWTRLQGASSTPDYRFGLAYDQARHRAVLAGGEVAASTTWEWDGSAWLLVSSGGFTPGRWYPGAAYDTIRQRVVLFGGYTGGVLDDTWEWNGSAWSARTLSTRPPARYAVVFAAFPARGSLLLFGGVPSSGPFLADLWELGASGWTDVSSPGPAGRASAAGAYDSVRRQLIVFGGVGNSGRLGDTWVWSDVTVLTAQPQSRSTCPSRSVAFTVQAAGAEPFAFQWQITDATAPGGWANIVDGDVFTAGQRVGSFTGATTPTLLCQNFLAGPVYPVVQGPLPLRCIVTNACGSVTSNLATLTICVADTDDGSGTGVCDGGVTIDDLLYYLNIFEQGTLAADVDDGSNTGTPDGGVTIDDLLYYLARFESGC